MWVCTCVELAALLWAHWGSTGLSSILLLAFSPNRTEGRSITQGWEGGLQCKDQNKRWILNSICMDYPLSETDDCIFKDHNRFVYKMTNEQEQNWTFALTAGPGGLSSSTWAQMLRTFRRWEKSCSTMATKVRSDRPAQGSSILLMFPLAFVLPLLPSSSKAQGFRMHLRATAGNTHLQTY